MLDTILTNLNPAAALSLPSLLLSLAVALVSGIAISLLYIKTNGSTHSTHLATTLVFLPAVISVVIMLVGDNIAGAFSLAGLFTIIRFRSAPGSSKEILFILFCVGAGLAYGLSLYGYGLLFTLIMASVFLALHKARFGQAARRYQLKIVTPDDMNNHDVFAGVLERYCRAFTLERIGTKDLGSVYELMYAVTLSSDTERKDLIDDLRRHNGNMNITLTNGADTYAF